MWDNSDAYDQIGYAAVDGNWGVTWAAGEVCGDPNSTFYDPDAYTLSLSKAYTFKMEISAGKVTYSVFLDPCQGGVPC